MKRAIPEAANIPGKRVSQDVGDGVLGWLGENGDGKDEHG